MASGLWAFVRYVRLKLLASFVRFMTRMVAPKRLRESHPDTVLRIPSRDKRRTIRAHLYKPSGEGAAGRGPLPTLISFNGSGFVVPTFGSDDYFCRVVADAAGYAVLDVEYRLAPEYPFPAAVNDVEDAVKYVLGRPEEYDTSRVSVCGFSSGGTLSIVAPSLFPAGTFRSLTAFYPATDLSVDPDLRRMAVPTAKRRSSYWTRIFRDGYLGDMDRRDPRISPAFGDTSDYPARILVITAELDTSVVEAEEWVEKARTQGEASGRSVVTRRMKDCGHGFDKMTKDERFVQARDESYGLVIDMLKAVAADSA